MVIMDGKSISSRSSFSSSNTVESKRPTRQQKIPPNGVGDNLFSDKVSSLHIQNSLSSTFYPTSSQNVSHGGSFHPSYALDEGMPPEEKEIRALCQERLENVIRHSSMNVPTVVINMEPLWSHQSPLLPHQSSRNLSPTKQSSFSPLTVQGLTTDRTRRRLSTSFKPSGRTTWGAGMVRPATNPDFCSSESYAYVGSGPTGSQPTSHPQTPSGLSPVESVYSIDPSALAAGHFGNETVVQGPDLLLANAGPRSMSLRDSLGANATTASEEQDLWSIGSIISPPDTKSWCSTQSPSHLSLGNAYTVAGTSLNPIINTEANYEAPQHLFGTSVPAYDSYVRIPLSSDSSTIEDRASLNMKLSGTGGRRLSQPHSQQQGQLQTLPPHLMTSCADSSTEPLAQIYTYRASPRQKSVRWARRPSESPSPSLIAKNRLGENDHVAKESDLSHGKSPRAAVSPIVPFSPGVSLSDETVPTIQASSRGDLWQVHTAQLSDGGRSASDGKPEQLSQKFVIDNQRELLRQSLGVQKPHNPASVAADIQMPRENTAGKVTKWNRLGKLGWRIPGDRTTVADRDRWGAAVKQLKTRLTSTGDRKRLMSMVVLGPNETECLIETLQSLRESIEMSSARLDLELHEMDPVSTFRMRRQAYHGHSDGNTQRISIPTGRSVRSRGTRFEFGRRSGGHRRADEIGQNREEKVQVEVRVVFLKIGEIDTLKEFYYADAFIQAKWREPKLDDRTTEELTITELEQYWNPLLYIDNILSETKETQWMMAQRNDAGQVYLLERRRIKGLFLETLELNDFPLDVQDLTITVTTERPDTEVDIIPDQSEMSAINSQTFVDQQIDVNRRVPNASVMAMLEKSEPKQEWKLHEHVEITKRIMKQEYSSSMKSHPCLSVTCRAARRPGYFYWNVFLIMFMISGLAFATFAVSPDKAELRLRLSFTLILTSVTFKYVITQSLPKISYLTYMDKYVLMSLAILCIISVWHAIVTLWDPDADTEMFNITRVHQIRTQTLGVTAPTILLAAKQTVGTRLLNSTTDNRSRRTTIKSDTRSRASQTTFSPLVNGTSTALFSSNNTTEPFINLTGAPKPISQTTPRNTTFKPRSLSSISDGNVTWLRPKEEECSRNNRMACEEWKLVQQVEQHVLTSFAIIYVAAHAIFIFWLYFDASRRRREMRQKDRDYRAFIRRHHQWQHGQRQREMHAIRRSSVVNSSSMPRHFYFHQRINAPRQHIRQKERRKQRIRVTGVNVRELPEVP